MINGIRYCLAVLLRYLSRNLNWCFALRLIRIGVNNIAKESCSQLFISGLSEDTVRCQDLQGRTLGGLFRLEKIDYRKKTVIGSMNGLGGRKVKFHPLFGCTTCKNRCLPPIRSWNDIGCSYLGDMLIAGYKLPGVNYNKLCAIADESFVESDPYIAKNTRAVAVIYKNHLVYEKYAPGIGYRTLLPGWSLTKTAFGNAVIGLMVKQGLIGLNDGCLMKEWRGADDPRRRITMKNLLHMNSGLDFTSDYDSGIFHSDLLEMLYIRKDMGRYAAKKDLKHPPGAVWNYSSSTTNIISLIAKRTLGKDYHAFPHKNLFGPLGINNYVFETDCSGTYVASSYLYLTARDWARLGLLYLHRGCWNGSSVLPENWIDFSLQCAPGAPEKVYGAHLWLNPGYDFDRPEISWEDLPQDAYFMFGHYGQCVAIFPSDELVVVRMGRTDNYSHFGLDKIIANPWNVGQFLSDIYHAIKNP